MSASNPIVILPKLNPVKFYDIARELPWCQTNPNHFTKPKYEQIFSRFDTLAFQIKIEDFYASDIVPTITCTAYDINEKPAYTFTVNLLLATPGIAGYVVYEVRECLVGIPEGVYQLRLHVENNDVSGPPILLNSFDFYSEPLYLQDQWSDSLLFEYGHENNNLHNMLFVEPSVGTTFYKFWHRVKGGFDPTDHLPSIKSTVYRDQEFDSTLLNAISYEVDKLTSGDGAGIPNWQADILNRILACNSKTINGKSYAFTENTKMEKKAQEKWPLLGWKIELEVIDDLGIAQNGDYDVNNDYDIPDYF